MSIAIVRKIRNKYTLPYFTELIGKIFSDGKDQYTIISYDEAYLINPGMVMDKIDKMEKSYEDYVFYKDTRGLLGYFYKRRYRTWNKQFEMDRFIATTS